MATVLRRALGGRCWRQDPQVGERSCHPGWGGRGLPLGAGTQDGEGGVVLRATELGRQRERSCRWIPRSRHSLPHRHRVRRRPATAHSVARSPRCSVTLLCPQSPGPGCAQRSGSASPGMGAAPPDAALSPPRDTGCPRLPRATLSPRRLPVSLAAFSTLVFLTLDHPRVQSSFFPFFKSPPEDVFY